jgi:hypothetical protein
MALPPHELDPVFQDIATAKERIVAACDAAADAHSKRRQELAKNPGLMTGSPAQAAREEFLKSLGITSE